MSQSDSRAPLPAPPVMEGLEWRTFNLDGYLPFKVYATHNDMMIVVGVLNDLKDTKADLLRKHHEWMDLKYPQTASPSVVPGETGLSYERVKRLRYWIETSDTHPAAKIVMTEAGSHILEQQAEIDRLTARNAEWEAKDGLYMQARRDFKDTIRRLTAAKEAAISERDAMRGVVEAAREHLRFPRAESVAGLREALASLPANKEQG